MKEYIVIKDRKSEIYNAIKLKKNDIVKCLEESDENGDWAGWIYCKSLEGEGWVPKQIIQKKGNEGMILEDYDATEFDLVVGEILISEKELNGWIYGMKKNEKEKYAWAPLNHIQKI
jgi:hypothetical protein